MSYFWRNESFKKCPQIYFEQTLDKEGKQPIFLKRHDSIVKIRKCKFETIKVIFNRNTIFFGSEKVLFSRVGFCNMNLAFRYKATESKGKSLYYISTGHNLCNIFIIIFLFIKIGGFTRT